MVKFIFILNHVLCHKIFILFTDEPNHIGDGEDKTRDQQNGIETAADPSNLINFTINSLQQKRRRSISLSTVEDLTKIPDAVDPIVIDLITSPLQQSRRRSISLSPELSNKRLRKNDDLSFIATSCSDVGK